VSWKLILVTSLPDRPVREGTGIIWNVTDLEPGKYRLVASWVRCGRQGRHVRREHGGHLQAGGGRNRFRSRHSQEVPTWWVVGIGLAVVIGAAIGIAAAAASDISFDMTRSPSPVDPPR